MTNETEMPGLQYMQELKTSKPQMYLHLIRGADSCGVRAGALTTEALNNILNRIGNQELAKEQELTDRLIRERAELAEKYGAGRTFSSFRAPGSTSPKDDSSPER